MSVSTGAAVVDISRAEVARRESLALKASAEKNKAAVETIRDSRDVLIMIVVLISIV